MKIETLDGSIQFESGSLNRSLDRQEFLATEIGKGAAVRNVNKDWWHVTFHPEQTVTVKLIYKDSRLYQAYLLLEIPSDKTDNWTAEQELHRKLVHDRWLQNELGIPPYQYAWGDVVSEFDQKACVSEIIVTYAS